MPSQNPFRIIHVFPDSPRLSNGPCNAAKAFMQCQLQRGMDVRGIGPLVPDIPPGRSQPIEHLPIEELDLNSPGFFATAIAASPADMPAVYHFHGISPWGEKLGKELRRARKRYVFTSHGQLHFRGALHGLKKFVYLNLVSHFLRDAGGLHFLTRREKERCRFLLPGFRKPTVVQPNMPELPGAGVIQPSAREQWGIDTGAFVFAYLGRLDIKTKGLDLLLDAFSRVAAGGANADLIMIGPDFAGGRSLLEEQAKRLGCGKRLHFLGAQTGGAKWGVLKMADAFVSPSRWEANSIAQAEAIGVGLPTILSAAVNVAPEAEAAGAAFVAQLSPESIAGAMRRLMDDPQLRRSLSEGGRRWIAQTSSFEQAGARFEEFYKAVLAAGG